MTSFVFRETLMMYLLLWGSAYSQIIRNARGEIIALFPLVLHIPGLGFDGLVGYSPIAMEKNAIGRQPLTVLSNKVAVLEEGMKYTPISISPNEAQFIFLQVIRNTVSWGRYPCKVWRRRVEADFLINPSCPVSLIMRYLSAIPGNYSGKWESAQLIQQCLTPFCHIPVSRFKVTGVPGVGNVPFGTCKR